MIVLLLIASSSIVYCSGVIKCSWVGWEWDMQPNVEGVVDGRVYCIYGTIWLLDEPWAKDRSFELQWRGGGGGKQGTLQA